MTYNTLKVNNTEPQGGDIDLTLDEFITNTPEDGDILKRTVAGFEAFPAPAGGGEVQLMTAMWMNHTTNALMGTYSFGYNATYWPYVWPRSIVQNYTYGDATYVNVDRRAGLSVLYAHNTWSCGVTLTPGTYLITCVPSNRVSQVTWQLYHTAENYAYNGTLFGNKVRVNPVDGKTGNMMIGYLEITTTRDVFPKLVAGSGTYDDANTFPSFHFNVRKLA